MNDTEMALIATLAAALRSPEEQAASLKVSEDEAIARFCALMAFVRKNLDLDGPADCFCPGTFRDPTGYRNDGRAIEFIEQTVKDALAARRTT